MRLTRTLLVWASIALIATGAFGAQEQTDSNLLTALEGHSVTQGQPDWAPLHKLIVEYFPSSKSIAQKTGTYYVWRIRDEELVFQATNPPSSDGESSCGFFWFDLHAVPISCVGFGSGHRLFYQSCALVREPGVSNFVVEATLTSPVSKPVVEAFGLDGYRPALIRYGSSDGNLLQNPSDVPNFACGPRPFPYDKSSLSDALSGSNPILQLEALTWLSARHSPLSADIVDIAHEAVDDSIRFWTLSNDTTVSQSAGTLEGSDVEWVSQAAKYFVKVNKPQTAPSQPGVAKNASLLVKDLKVGSGGPFDDAKRTVRVGDRVVVNYEIRTLSGALLFSNFGGDGNPPVFEVGSNQVVDGLGKALAGMKVGGIRVIVMPARMAFGEAGADVIPPGSDLIWRFVCST